MLFADIEEMIGAGCRVQLRIKGHSMRPFLRDGIDVVNLSPLDNVRLRRGMVVLFRYKGSHILHRIRRIKGDVLTMKGDGNYRITESCTLGDVVAYAEAIERDGRVIPYRSLRWRRLTMHSLFLKSIRAFRIAAVRLVKKITWR